MVRKDVDKEGKVSVSFWVDNPTTIHNELYC